MIKSTPFTIERNTWYAWLMFPGYESVPYFSPIYVTEVQRLKTGKQLLDVHFRNVFYAHGVQGFETRLHVYKRTKTYLLGEILPESDRSALISAIDFSWLTEYGYSLLTSHPIDKAAGEADNIQAYLNRAYKTSARL